jgi:UDP-N-acetylmuramate dehydrogenase
MKTRQKDFEKAAEKLRKEISGRVEERVMMKRYTSFRIGGLCELMVFPEDTEELAKVVDLCEKAELPWMILGRGSNLLVLDNDLEMIVINLQTGLKHIEQTAPGRVRAEAGVNLNRLVKVCQDLGLSGLEWAAGIPGTVGGAIRMNAGAEKKDISMLLKRVEFFRAPKGVFTKSKDELKMGYREFDLPDKTVILAGEFELSPDTPRAIRSRIRSFIKRRRRSQPVSLPSAGSVFKNPPGAFAGKMIEDAGFKGFRLGDAQVSEMHANFIVNRGRAKASQVLELIDMIRDKVRKETGVKLELEIEIVGKEND